MITAFFEFMRLAVGRARIGILIFFSVLFVSEAVLLSHPWINVDLWMQLVTKTIASFVVASTFIIAIALGRCIAKSKVGPVIKHFINQLKKSA
jgi:hypothetical protein